MRLRWQYSLSMLMLLLFVTAFAIEFWVKPWRERVHQAAIITKLQAGEKDVSLSIFQRTDDLYSISDVYELEKWRFLLEHMQDSALIGDVNLQQEFVAADDLAKLRRLSKLDSLGLSLFDSGMGQGGLNEQHMQVLRSLPLKKLHLDCNTDNGFQTWPIAPSLAEFHVRGFYFNTENSYPPLNIENHRHLENVSLRVTTGNIFQTSFVKCPKLKELDFYLNQDRPASKLRFDNLRSLERLSIEVFQTPELISKKLPQNELIITNQPNLALLTLKLPQRGYQGEIYVLPELRLLEINSPVLPLIKDLECRHPLTIRVNSENETIRPQDLERLFFQPQLVSLTVTVDWSNFDDRRITIPKIPQLRELNLMECSEDLAFRVLRQTPALRKLSLGVDNAFVGLLQIIGDLEQLEELELIAFHHCEVLTPLHKCSRLRRLKVSRFENTTAQLESLSKFQHLETLELVGNQLPADELLKYIPPSVKHFSINGRRVSEQTRSKAISD